MPTSIGERFAKVLCMAALVHLGSESLLAEELQADLLIVGGTESGCAAAVQAARMGVKRIVLVNDIEWLGGQFSAEALMAFDENTDIGGIRHEPPMPRHGAFREIIDRIEADNVEKYGVARPGNTRVITTCRPADAERVFQEWLAPYVTSGQVIVRSWYEPHQVETTNGRVAGVTFVSRRQEQPLKVRARLTIDASDWGDVVRLSGAAYEFGPDLKRKYGEPLAPVERTDYPLTDMNPITFCMVIVETDQFEPIPMPHRYNAENYRTHRWPKDPLWLYETRRLVDHYHFPQIPHPDVLLLCFPAFDYPLDVYPQSVANALNATEEGASKKNVVEMTPSQRQIVFEDAKQYSLGFLYYLQTEVHSAMPDTTHSFRRFRLTDEFGTLDRMPPKPYVRESLRMKAMYMMRQQDTMGVNNDSANFAQAMYHDTVGAWQFEYDFHPTRREFLNDGDTAGPWRNGFRDGRTWGPPYSGRSTLPLRSLIPEKLDGLLAAQKNIGFSSIVSAAVRLHDTSMAVGKASGACAGIALLHHVRPRDIPFDRSLLMEVQLAVAESLSGQSGGILIPFRDVAPDHPSFAAINILAAQGCVPMLADEVHFRPDDMAEPDWVNTVVNLTQSQLADDGQSLAVDGNQLTRGEFAERLWQQVRSKSWKPYHRKTVLDADLDGIPDADDALPLDADNSRLKAGPVPQELDGQPSELPPELILVRQFDFGGEASPCADGFLQDAGHMYRDETGFGWKRSMAQNHRRRSKTVPPADTFLFTRSHDTWEYALPNGDYHIDVCIGDSGHEQFGQNLTIEGQPLCRDVKTAAGRFAEYATEVSIGDGKLTLEIGLPDSATNTCLNWLRISRRR